MLNKINYPIVVLKYSHIEEENLMFNTLWEKSLFGIWIVKIVFPHS